MPKETHKRKILKPKTTELFEVIFIDFCGPLKTTITGKRYTRILAIIDHFSRYVSLHAVARQDEKTTAEVIKKQIDSKIRGIEIYKLRQRKVIRIQRSQELS